MRRNKVERQEPLRDPWEAYASVGTGEVLVQLPGLFAGGWIWEDTNQFLQERFRLITLAEPFAKMDLPSASINSLVEYTEQLFDQLGIPRAVLLGNSLGGIVALAFAAKHPTRVEALIVSGAPAEPKNDMMLPAIARNLTIEGKEQIVSSLFYQPRFLADQRVRATFDLTNDRAVVHCILRLLKDVRDTDVDALIEKILCPVFFVWGKYDRVAPFEVWQAKISRMASASVAVIEEAGHSPMIEEPLEFAKYALDFLTQVVTTVE